MCGFAPSVIVLIIPSEAGNASPLKASDLINGGYFAINGQLEKPCAAAVFGDGQDAIVSQLLNRAVDNANWRHTPMATKGSDGWELPRNR